MVCCLGLCSRVTCQYPLVHILDHRVNNGDVSPARAHRTLFRKMYLGVKKVAKHPQDVVALTV